MTGLTITEKILSNKAGKTVKAMDYVKLKVDVAMANDITAPVAIKEFQKAGGTKVFDTNQVVLVPSHFAPNKDIFSAEQTKQVREFAKSQNIEKYFELGRMGIEHVILPAMGIVKSGDLVIGADSHTCTNGALGAFSTGVGSTDIAGVYLTGYAWFRVPQTILVNLNGKFNKNVSGKDLILKIIKILGVDGANYKTIEFAGDGVKNISMDSRFTVSNMAIEAGGKAGIFPVDQVTIDYEKQRGIEVEKLQGDENASYCKTLEINLDELQPQVAYPYLPSNCKDIKDAEKDRIFVDQVVIGSCTNGRIEDLRNAANILKGNKINKDLRCIVIPGSQQVYKQAIKEGLVDIFIDSECVFSTTTCGPCLGGHMGVLADGEKCLSTTNRNFVGRMGHRGSKVYLASPVIAAATAINGYISGI